MVATAAVHPDLGEKLLALVAATQANKVAEKALVHGDVSPKKHPESGHGPTGPVFCRCRMCVVGAIRRLTWRSAPQSFAAEMPVDSAGAADGFLRCFDALAAAYLRGVTAGNRRTRWNSAAAAIVARIVAGAGRRQIAGRIRHEQIAKGPGPARGSSVAGRSAVASGRDSQCLEKGTRRMTETSIAFVHARQVWGQPRAKPTVEADVMLESDCVWGGRSPLPEPRRAAARRWICAMVAKRSAVMACSERWRT